MGTAGAVPDTRPLYQRPADEVVAALGTDRQRGLTQREAWARLERHGRNPLRAEKPVPAWRRFLEQFRSTLVVLLLVAAAISVMLWVYEHDTALPYEAIAIFAIVLFNAAMGYVQQARSKKALEALRGMSAARANVVRDGDRRSIPAAELVPGDIILIEEGDTIPADARLVESAALNIAEAALTGESVPVPKDAAAIFDHGETALGARRNMVFSGTAATSGRGWAVVTATGFRNFRRAHFRRGPGGRGSSVRSAGRCTRRTRPWRAAHGGTKRDRPPPCCGGDARLGERHRVRQNRHADKERDDDTPDRYRERPRGCHRDRVSAEGRDQARGRRGAGRRQPVRGPADALRRQAGQHEGSGNLRYAQTMAFTTLTLCQLFNVFSARSDERSAFDGLFGNH